MRPSSSAIAGVPSFFVQGVDCTCLALIEFAFAAGARLLETGVRKCLLLFVVCLTVVWKIPAAETLTMTDNATFVGDIIKFNDIGLMLRTGDTYTNLMWGRFSQASLKHLATNPKIRPFVGVFIDPVQSARPPKAEIKINPVSRLERPTNPSILGGLVGSLLGKFILLMLYLANLYAAFEVSIIRGRPAALVIGLSAVLPVIGPILFLSLPMNSEEPAEDVAAETPAAPVETPSAAAPVEVVETSPEPEKKKPAPQIFARGKFTFNKRFVETKFAGYIGAPKSDALNFSMEIKSAQGQFAVGHIEQVTATDVVFETTSHGQMSVPLAAILEIRLNPKAA